MKSFINQKTFTLVPFEVCFHSFSKAQRFSDLFLSSSTKLLSILKMNRPAPVEISYDCLRFLITHNPTNAQLGKFIEVAHVLTLHSCPLFPVMRESETLMDL